MIDIGNGIEGLCVTQQCSGDLLVTNSLVLETTAFGTLLISPCDNVLLVYKVSTMASSDAFWLKLTGHSKHITCVREHPVLETRIISSSLDSYILIWDYVNMQVDVRICINFPVLSFIANSKCDSFYCCIPGAVHKSKKGLHLQDELNYRLATFDLDGKEGTVIFQKIRHGKNCLGIGNKNGLLAGNDLSSLLVYRLKREKFFKHYVVSDADQKVTCLSVHPQSSCVAVGLSTGRICLLSNVYKPNKLVRRIMHWHIESVLSLAFVLDGSVLYSGGSEAVLVKWDLNPDSGEQSTDFLPRLGGSVACLSSSSHDGTLAVSIGDNSVMVVSPSAQKLARIHGLSASALTLSESAGAFCMTVDPATQLIVKSSVTPGTLQFFSIFKNAHLGTLDIIRPNFTVVRSATGSVSLPEIAFAVFSDYGRWLVTLTTRKDEQVPENSLKFWSRRSSGVEESPEFDEVTEDTLNESDIIVSLAFQPRVEDKLVASTRDGRFMSWRSLERLKSDEHGKPTKYVVWQRLRTWKLGNEFSGGLLSFSADGDLLLCSHQQQHCLSLWETMKLNSPPKLFSTSADEGQSIRFCAVLREDLVLCCTDVCLKAWKSSSYKEPVLTKDIAFTCADYSHAKDLFVLCSGDSKLTFITDSSLDSFSTVDLICEFNPAQLCILESTIVFLSSDNRLFVYPELTYQDVQVKTTTTPRSWLLEAGTTSKLSHIFKHDVVYDEVLSKRLESFVGAEAFAAPNLTRFVSQNLELHWKALMKFPLEEDKDRLQRSTNFKDVHMDSESDDEEVVKKKVDIPQLSDEVFDQALMGLLTSTSVELPSVTAPEVPAATSPSKDLNLRSSCTEHLLTPPKAPRSRESSSSQSSKGNLSRTPSEAVGSVRKSARLQKKSS